MTFTLRRTCLAAAAILAATLTAQAADVPVYKAPIKKAPPIAYYGWSGLYLGAHLGYGWGDKDWTNTANNSNSVDVDGFLGGLQLGFNYEFNSLVVGIEGDWSWTGIDGQESAGVALAICTTAIPCDANVKWLATVAGRLGFTWGPGLLYVKGGAAWARDNYSFLNTVSTASDTRSGWVFGVGLEYMMAARWSAKLEYNYLDLGTDALIFSPGGGTVNIDQEIHAIKLGINYHFNWGGPIVTKY